MTDRTIAFAVRTGQRITFHEASGREVSGYVCGMDDFHWKVISPDNGAVSCVHKSASFDVSPDPTYDNEHNRDSLEKVVGPFRDWVGNTFFRSTPAPVSDIRQPSREVKSA